MHSRVRLLLAAACLAALPSAHAQSTPFDGASNVTLICPPHHDDNDAQGHTYRFAGSARCATKALYDAHPVRGHQVVQRGGVADHHGCDVLGRRLVLSLQRQVQFSRVSLEDHEAEPVAALEHLLETEDAAVELQRAVNVGDRHHGVGPSKGAAAFGGAVPKTNACAGKAERCPQGVEILPSRIRRAPRADRQSGAEPCHGYSYGRGSHHGKNAGMSLDTLFANCAGRFSRKAITPSFASGDAPRA